MLILIKKLKLKCFIIIMNILSLFSFGLNIYLLHDNLSKINYDFCNFLTLSNLINYLYILIFHFYYNNYVLICIFITSFKLSIDILLNHPMYQLNIQESQNQAYIFGAIMLYLLFNFFRGFLNVLSIII